MDFDRVAYELHRLLRALASLAISFAQHVPDDRRIAIDLLALLADRPQRLDHDLRQQLLVVNTADLRGAALAVDARDRLRIREELVKLKEIADVRPARVLAA